MTFIHSQVAKLDHICILGIETGTTISDKNLGTLCTKQVLSSPLITMLIM